MLTKKNRLHTHKEIKMTFARGRAFFSPYFLGKFQLVPSETKKFTVVVSTKVSKKAVVRNRIKRILREVLKANVGAFNPGNYIFTVKPKAVDVYETGLSDVFLEFLERNKLIKK
jgi:ribonuclease P protein component